jgi:hypothetical protein
MTTSQVAGFNQAYEIDNHEIFDKILQDIHFDFIKVECTHL